MNTSLILLLAGLAGVGLGALFFGGLWWTIRLGAMSSRPALWFLLSGILRMGIVLTGFYIVGSGEWPRLVACLTGFVSARIFVTRLTRPRVTFPHDSNREARRAP